MKKAFACADMFRALKRQSLCRSVSLPLITFLVFSSLAVVTACAANFIGARGAMQNSISGEWLAEFNRDNADKVQFNIIRRSAGGGQHNSSNGIALGELQGLTRQQAFGARTDVNFRLVREAGTFLCEGTFREGKGAGHWTLTPNQSFISAMRSRGYDGLSEDDLFSAALFDINIKTIEDLKAAGYDRLTFKELVEASIFNVTGDFAREMKSAGFDNLTIKQLVEARIFKIDGQYAKEVEAMGFGRQPLKTLVETRIFKITPEFIREMRSMGFENLTLKQLTEMSIHKVTPDFVNGIKSEGYASVSPREAVNLKIHGVDQDFIRRVRAKGFNNLTLNKLVELRIHGIIE
ncbi:MAG TPA: hypothetical protein VER76_17360 [Pyrinomonadaceae bacterium]|nr:hypothetical protein [Pyrinomonadaceae bacterium]